VKLSFKMAIKKRGQITVFIIVGLIVLMTYFLLSQYRKESIEETEVIIPELIPVQQYVMTCTKTIGQEALDIIGLNGGYIYFPIRIENDASTYLQSSPIGDLKNPYWWYNNIQSVPEISFMESQISDYVKQYIGNCIDNFSAFYNQYEVIGLGQFDVVTEIGEEDVTIKTIYPIEVKDKFNKTLAELQKFPVVIPVRLKQVHDFAKQILEGEGRDAFIERKIIDLISLDDSGIPTTGIDVSCGSKRWEIADVKDRLKELMQANLPYVKVKGTNFNENFRITSDFSPIPSYTPVDGTDPVQYNLEFVDPIYENSYYHYHYIWDISDITYPNMKVAFNYDQSWPIDFYVRPNHGRYMQSNSHSAGGIMSLFCLHIWHFTYDVITPIKVTIVDEKTKDNDEYAFNFAFKTQINHNQPDRSNFVIESFDARDTYLEEEYCADVDNEIIITAMETVKDTKTEIRYVNITFICGSYYCDMGSTKSYLEDATGIPKLKKRFPYCSNGIIRANREGYQEGEVFIQTGRRLDRDPEDQIGGSFIVGLKPIKEFNVSVVKHKLVGEVVGGETQLGDEEQATIVVRNKDEKFESYAVYPIEWPLKLLNKDFFTYDVEVYMMDNDTITGGYSGEWTPDKNLMRVSDEAVFHVVTKDFSDEEEMFLFFASLEDNSKKVPVPELK